MSIVSKVSVSPNEVRNSKLFDLVKKGVLKMDNPIEAKLPSGRSIEVKMDANGIITKSFTNAKGHKIDAKFDVVEDGTRLVNITEKTPVGVIDQVFLKDGRIGGHIWTTNSRPWSGNDLVWGYTGLVNNPTKASTCLHSKPYKNEESIDAFKTAVDYIRGNGSIDTYKAQMAK